MIRSHSDIHLDSEGSLQVRVTEHGDFVAFAITVIGANGMSFGTHTYYAQSLSQLGRLADMVTAKA